MERKKRGRLSKVVKKKRGRPTKIKPVEEVLESSGKAPSPVLASAPLDNPTVSRCQTRYAKDLADKEAALSNQARFSFQNGDGKSSENSTLLLVKQLLIDSNRLSPVSNDPLEAQTSGYPLQDPDLHSQHDNIRRDPIIGAWDGTNFSSKTENHNVPTVNLVDNKSSENNEVTSQDSQLENSIVDVNGYKAKKEIAPLLKAIFTKYGDIAKDSTFSLESRSYLLEMVCNIYKRLEASEFTQLTNFELQSMLGQIGDLELVKVEVGWLHKRLDQISKARQICGGASILEDINARTMLVIDEKEKTVKMYEEELEISMAAVKKLQERLQQEKDELSAALALVDEVKNFCEGSLVHGLI